MPVTGPSRINGLASVALSAAATDTLPLDNPAFLDTKQIAAAALVSSFAVTGNILYVDKVNGGTGTRGILTQPFSTITLALAAASSGDLVVVYPGTYNEKNIGKNGVNLHFMAGANVVYTGSATGGIFDDSATGANGPIICTITGAGVFTNSTTAAANLSNNTVLITNSNSSVIIQCQSIAFTGPSTGVINAAAVRHKAGYLSTTADLVQGVGNFNFAYWWDAGDSHLNAKRVLSTTSAAVYVTATGTDSLWIRADKISAQTAAIVGASGNVNSRVWIEAHEIRSESTGIQFFANKNYVRCAKLSAAATPIDHEGGQSWFTIQKLTIDSGGTNSIVADGSVWLDIENVEDLGCLDVALNLTATSGNVVNCRVGHLKTSAGALGGLRLLQSGTGRCAFGGLVDASPAAAGNPIILSTGTGTLLDGTVLISAGVRECITQDTGSGTINVYGVAYVTHAKNASVTLGMGTLTTIVGMT